MLTDFLKKLNVEKLFEISLKLNNRIIKDGI